MDYVNIGCTPTEESCFPVGHRHARVECSIFARQLRREFPEADIRIKGFPHDFGTYYEAVATYSDCDSQSEDVAYTVEGECPMHWDEMAKQELKALYESY